jgi:beta-mannosidase
MGNPFSEDAGIKKCGLFKRLMPAWLLIVCFCCAQAQTAEINLTQSWYIRKSGDAVWQPATVPGSVHTDLMALKKIPDPYFRDNESQVQWVENEDWEYQTVFNCPENILSSQHAELVFNGFDTFCDVLLNDSVILRANNMFRSWTVEVKHLLRSRENRLLLRFTSSVRQGGALADSFAYPLPGDEDGRVFVRKPAYQYGWDWGPRLVTCGIWRPIVLRGWNNYRIDLVDCITHDLTPDAAVLKVSVRYRGDFGFGQLTTATLGHVADSFIYIRTESRSGAADFYFTKSNPKLWWPNGAGNPHLYKLPLTLWGKSTADKNAGEAGIGLDTISFGIRTVDLVQQPDAAGTTFNFSVNGTRLFMKGANIIPPDNFLSRTRPDQYRKLVEDAALVKMNMLRVWGGGAYLPDEFYDYCDEKGILVWQDFMFANAMCPGDSLFLLNVQQEAAEQVLRLRRHACLALWCGNNEIDEAWKNWGYQLKNKMKAGVNEEIAGTYRRIFDTILRRAVEMYDPTTPYWPTSPLHGWGHNESLREGDAHYWGVWWARAPFSAYESHVGRFMSEYGFQSMPLASWDEFTTAADRKTVPEDKRAANSVMNTHQKHPYGYENIYGYMSKQYPVPADFMRYAYVSQLVQRDGMTMAIEAHRRARPYCMGTLYWQLNDCWPVTSWSSVDYYGEWKAVHYELQRLYGTVLISVSETKDSALIYLISDSVKQVAGELTVDLISLDGKKQSRLETKSITLPAASSAKVGAYFKKLLPKGRSAGNTMMRVTLQSGGKVLAYKNHYFTKPGKLRLTDPGLSSTVKYVGSDSSRPGFPASYLITLQSAGLAKDVCLQYDFEAVTFSENFFDLLPGQQKTVMMFAREPVDEKNLPLKIFSLIDAR